MDPLPDPVVVPLVYDDGVNIVIRKFRPEDAPQLHAMLIEGIIHGPDSPRNNAHRKSLTSRVAFISYIGFALGLAACLYPTSVFPIRLAGAASSLFSIALFVSLRRSITKLFIAFCAAARNGDMKDIDATYASPGGFWVAAIEDKEGLHSEVVGYLGSDYNATPSPTSAELRRMIVSRHHRRRRIASLLITAAVAHSARVRVPVQVNGGGSESSKERSTLELDTLDLETPSFHLGAQKLYRRHGFEIVGSRVMHAPAPRWLGKSLFEMTVVRLRRSGLGEGEMKA
ncbi:hypothetical protein R3P38DRAFT_1187537 [Favolaschia claudopus]|uniref:N-acetyltransferase domain-containing protein n=1 Tax=Favolaschia claudopus TaxID=2862362 RepID=A0AAW0E2P0_9AGAR